MSHQTPKEKATDLWREMADLAEREGGLVETSVVDLFERKIKVYEAEIKNTERLKPKSYPSKIEPSWEDLIDWNEIGFMYYGVSYDHCCVFDHSDEYPMCDYCGKPAFRSEG